MINDRVNLVNPGELALGSWLLAIGFKLLAYEVWNLGFGIWNLEFKVFEFLLLNFGFRKQKKAGFHNPAS